MVKNLDAPKGKKTIILVSFDERGTPFKRSPTHQKSVPPCSNTHALTSSSLHTKSLFPPCLIGSGPESNMVSRKPRQRLRIISLPRIHLLRSPSADHSTSIIPVEEFNPVSIARNVRHLVLEVPLGVCDTPILIAEEERLPPQLSPEQISDDRDSVDHPLGVPHDISRVISIHFRYSPS